MGAAVSKGGVDWAQLWKKRTVSQSKVVRHAQSVRFHRMVLSVIKPANIVIHEIGNPGFRHLRVVVEAVDKAANRRKSETGRSWLCTKVKREKGARRWWSSNSVRSVDAWLSYRMIQRRDQGRI